MNRLVQAIALILVLATVRPAGAQTSVTMRTRAFADPGADIRLVDIAVIEGPQAGELGAIVVRRATKQEGAREAVTISPPDVRAALDSARVNWAKITLSGVPCTVQAAGQVAPAGASRPAPPDSLPQPVDLSGPATVQTLIAQRLAALFGVPIEDLRLRLPASQAEDRDLLATLAGAPRRIEVAPGSTSHSGRMPIRVDVYVADRLETSRTIAADVLVRRDGCVALAVIDRDQVIAPGDVGPDTRWLPPGAPVPVALEATLGQAARRRIDPGRPIVGEDVRPPLCMQRGDDVVVHTLSGGVVLKSRARALGPAREGEIVELRRDGSRKSFFARASARGIAVIDLSGPDLVPDERGPSASRSHSP